jgi:predicted NAD-dependent protein-ADP-ribosyltransferase YbiA (DUF1768 family)
MDIRSGNQWPSSALSNFAPHPFEFRGFKVNSMEGLLQGLKFKGAAMQAQIFTLVGKTASMQERKRIGKQARHFGGKVNQLKEARRNIKPC